MTTVVISQPFLFPWVGLWEQMALADVFVHADDVQFPKGHFVNRVQVKTEQGSIWLTIPLASPRTETLIRDVLVDDSRDWRSKHLRHLENAYRKAPFGSDMLELVQEVYAIRSSRLVDIVIGGLEAVAGRLGLDRSRRFLLQSELGVDDRNTARVLQVVRSLGGDRYVTGWGARNYLDHQRFEDSGVEVLYMDYARTPYPQLHGAFTASVSVLDLIANVGPDAGSFIRPRVTPWREFLDRQSPVPA